MVWGVGVQTAKHYTPLTPFLDVKTRSKTSPFSQCINQLQPTLDVSVEVEGVDECLFFDIGRNVGEVKRSGGRKYVGVILAPGLLEAVERRIGKVFGETAVGGALFRQLHGGVLGRGHANRFPEQLDLVQELRRLEGLESMEIFGIKRIE